MRKEFELRDNRAILRILNSAKAVIPRTRQMILSFCLVFLILGFKDVMPCIAQLVDRGDLVFKRNAFITLDREFRFGIKLTDFS